MFSNSRKISLSIYIYIEFLLQIILFTFIILKRNILVRNYRRYFSITSEICVYIYIFISIFHRKVNLIEYSKRNQKNYKIDLICLRQIYSYMEIFLKEYLESKYLLEFI